jgi:hypothetical protein
MISTLSSHYDLSLRVVAEQLIKEKKEIIDDAIGSIRSG